MNEHRMSVSGFAKRIFGVTCAWAVAVGWAIAASEVTVPTDYSTIDAAVTAVDEGGTVYVLPGTYTPPAQINKSVNIVGTGAATTFLDGGGSVGPVLDLFGDITNTVVGLTIRNGAGTSGGGVSVESSSIFAVLTLEDCVVSNNTATTAGSGIYGLYATINIVGTTVSGNKVLGATSAKRGGGIYADNSSVTVINSTISGNSAVNGGGVYLTDSEMGILHATITGNVATNTGGGLNIASGNFMVNNSVVAGNTAPTSANIAGLYTASDSIITGDPKLAPLADNGGPTPTHALLADSPALNYCTNHTASADQRGVSRPQGADADAGAFEEIYTAYVDDDWSGPEDCGGHIWGGDAFASVQAAVNAVASNGTVNVAAGSYSGSVSVPRAMTLLGANETVAGNGSRSAESTITSAGTALTLAANHITVKGFELDGAIGVAVDNKRDVTVQNNLVSADAVGIQLQNLATAAPQGVTVSNNKVVLSSQLAGSTPTAAIVLAGAVGDQAVVLQDNVIADAFYGYLLYAVNTAPRTTVSGGSISGVMQGVAIINVDPVTYSVYAPSTLDVDGVAMSGFAGNHGELLPAANFHAGVYVYTGGGSAAAKITSTLRNLNVSGTAKIQQDCAGLAFADFSTGAGVRQDIDVLDCTLTDNANRGIQARGANADITVSGCMLTNNGFDAVGTGGNDGYGIIARQSSKVAVSDCVISNPTTAGAVPFWALQSDTGAQLTVHGCDITAGAGKFAAHGGGTTVLDATNNWWGTPVQAAVAAGMNGPVLYTPWYSSDVKDNLVPYGQTLSASTVNENVASGTAIGTLGVTDSDGGTPTYSLADGGGLVGADNASFAIDGTTLETSAALNFEAQSSYTVCVQVSDGNGGFNWKTFAITVNDLNDAPAITESDPVSASMAEGNTVPAVWNLTLNASDADAGSTLTWSIQTQALNGEATASGTGLSKVIGYVPADSNWNGTDSFVVKVSDQFGLEDTVTVNVTVTPVNDAPACTAVPTVSGISQLGQVLTATTGDWNDSVDQVGSGSSTLDYAYQWQRSSTGEDPWTAIEGQIASTYTLTPADALMSVRVQVTATDNGVGEPSAQSTAATSTGVVAMPVRNVTRGTFHDTISSAIAAANALDIITVANGTYAEPLSITKALTIQSSDTGYVVEGDVTFDAQPIIINGCTLADNHVWKVTTNALIQNAIAAASSDDTVSILAGVHSENITVVKKLNLVGESMSTTSLNGGGSGVVVMVTANDVTMSGFTVTGSGVSGAAAGIGLLNVTGCSISGITATGNYVGIAAVGGGSHTVSGNTLTSNGIGITLENLAEFGGTINDGSTGNTIANNMVSGSLLHGINIPQSCDNNTVTNNTVSSSAATGIYLWKADACQVSGNTVTASGVNGIELMTSVGSTVSGNTVSGNVNGITVRSGTQPSANNTITGNTLSGSGVIGLMIEENALLQTFTGNMFTNNPIQVSVVTNTLTRDQSLTAESKSAIETILGANTYDRAVVIRGSGIQIPTIYSAIQAGVNAATAGQTVDVSAGNYKETVTISKALSLTGPNAAINPNTGTRVAEAVIDGTGLGTSDAITVAANDVTVKGFEICNREGNAVSCEGASGIGYWVKLQIENNDIHHVTDNALYVFRTYGGTSIRANRIHDLGGTSASGIYYYYDSDPYAYGNVIEANVISNTTYGGILMNGTAATLRNNIINNVPQQGIQIAGNACPVTVVGNEISNANTLLALTKGGIRLKGNTLGAITIVSNTISGSFNGIAVDDGSDLTGKPIHVNFNNLSNNQNLGIYHGSLSSSGDLDATQNWWGDANGPKHASNPLNSQTTGVGVTDRVIFFPWALDSGYTAFATRSNYAFAYDLVGMVMNEEQSVPITFATDGIPGMIGYAAVRFAFAATGPSTVTFKATDTANHEYTFVNGGYWGPASGFPLPADRSSTEPFKMTFAGAGSYTVSFKAFEIGHESTPFASGSETVEVAKATPAVVWPTASEITYAQPLSASSLTGGSATHVGIAVPGEFTFDTPAATPNAGNAAQNVTFTPTDTANYNTVAGTVAVQVQKATPSITWPTASDITYGDMLSDSSLGGGSAVHNTTPVPGAFAFTTPTSKPNSGTAPQSVTFTPSDAANYNPVVGDVSVTVAKSTPTVTTWPTASTILLGQSIGEATLSGGEASVLGTFAFDAPAMTPGVGTATFAMTFTPDDTSINTVAGSVTVTVVRSMVVWVDDNFNDSTEGWGVTNFARIQDGVNAVATNGTVNAFAGVYTELVSVNKALSLISLTQYSATLTAPGTASKAALVSVNASHVTVDGFLFAVNQPQATAGVVMDSNGVDHDTALTVQNCRFMISGAFVANGATAYIGFDTYSSAIAVNGMGGFPTVSFLNNEILPDSITAPTAMFDRAIFLREGNGIITNNTVYGDAHDLCAQFASYGTLTVENNRFLGKGGRDKNGSQVDFTEPNGTGSIVFQNNVVDPFSSATPSGSVHVRSLMIKTNQAGASIDIVGNLFTNVQEVAILASNSKSTTIRNNEFRAKTGDAGFVYLQIGNKIASGGTREAFQMNATVQGNVFRQSTIAGGRAIEFLNHNAVGATFGTITVGGAGALANTFESGLERFIHLDDEVQANSKNSMRPYYANYGSSVMAPFSAAIDATANLFDVGTGAQSPSLMAAADLFALENKIYHAADLSTLGLVRVKAANVYVTTASGSIQRGINAASTGDTVNVAAGTYSEQVSISKALTVTGQDGAILDGTGLAPTWTTGVKILCGNVTFNNIDVQDFTQDGITAYDNIDMPNLHITNCRIANIQPGYWGFGIYVGYESEGFGYVPPHLTTHLDFSGLLIESNEIVNVHSSALVLQSITGTPGTLIVRNNNIHDNTTNSGIWIDCARNLMIEDNVVVGNKWGIEISAIPEPANAMNGPYSPKDILVQGNCISNSTQQGIVLYQAWPGTIQFSENSITGNGTGLDNKLASAVLAENNWWGNATGPSNTTNPGGTGATVVGAVDFSPWLGDGTDGDAVAIGFQPNLTPVYYLPAGLMFSTQPVGDVALGVELSQQPVVTVTNEIGGVALQCTNAVTLAFGINPNGGVLNGTLTKAAVAGVATFTDLNVTVGGGTGFTLAASATSIMGATSAAFNIANPMPTAASLNPYWAKAGSGDFPLTVTGGNFVPTSVVRWNGEDLQTVWVSSTVVTATVPARLVASIAPVAVTVFNGEPPANGQSSAELAFRIEAAAPAVVYVDDNYVGLDPSTLVNWTNGAEIVTGRIMGYDAFAAVQDGVFYVATNGTVRTAAGLYAEQVVVDKAATLLGPYAAENPNTGTRLAEAEALLVPPSVLNALSSPREWNKDAVLKIAADGVVVRGFTISGDNPQLDGYNYAGMNVEVGIGVWSLKRNSVEFRNNIVENVTYMGFFADGGEYIDNPQYQGLTFEGNLIRSVHDLNQLGYGFGLYVLGTAGSIQNNVITNTRTGMQIQPYCLVGAVPPVVAGNAVSCWKTGIYFNYSDVGASAWTISGNTVAACAAPVAAPSVSWDGIKANSIVAAGNGVTISGNAVNGEVAMTDPCHADWGGFAHAVWGMSYAYGAPSSTSDKVYFTGNTVTNVSFGFVHAAPANIVLTGNSLSATESAIRLQRNYNSAGVAATTGGTNNIDATAGNVINGVDSSTATLEQLYAIEDAIRHKLDDATWGLVRVRATNLYVTAASASIQRGIDAAAAGDTVNVAAGTYNEPVAVNKAVAVVGAGKTLTTITQGVVLSALKDDALAQQLRDLSVVAATSPYIGDTGYAIRIDASSGDTAPVRLGNVLARSPLLSARVYGAGIFITPNGHVVDDVVITDGTFDGSWTHGLFVKNSSGSSGQLTHLVVSDTTFDRNRVKKDVLPNTANDFGFGVFILAGNANPSLMVSDVVFTRCSFNDHFKGIYAESLSNATFDQVTVTGCWREGLDLNLKWDDYTGPVFKQCELTGNGLQTPATYPDLHIKGRNDLPNYGANPASISGVSVSNSVIGYASFGNNITNITVTHSGLGALNNYTSAGTTVNAENNWFGSATGPSNTTNPGGTGAPVVGAVDFSPWLGTGDQDLNNIGFQPALTPIYYLPVGITFSTEPVGAPLGAAFGTQPSVTVTNEIGGVATQFNGSIALAIGTNPGLPTAGVLNGVTNIPVVSGVADFGGLSITLGTGDGYRLVASTTGLAPVTSEAFNILNSAPVLTRPIVIPPANEQAPMTFTAAATDTAADSAAQTLTFSLSGTIPAGASMSSDGVFTWTPDETQGGSNYTFTVVVTDNGTGNLFDSEEVDVAVAEVNVAPVLPVIGDKSANEQEELSFTVPAATDQDLPAQTLSYSLAAVDGQNYPAGVSIVPSTGAILWTPNETQGGSNYVMDVVVTDSGLNPDYLAATQRVTIVVAEVNVAPELGYIAPQSVNKGDILTFQATATDQDTPANALTFSLSGAYPAGAVMDEDTGVFTWLSTDDAASYSFTVTVSDGALSDSQTVTIGAVAATQDCAGYRSPSDSMVVSNSLAFSGTLTNLVWTPVMPVNWQVLSVSAVSSGQAVTQDNAVVFTTLPTQSPVVFTYTVRVPGNAAVSNSLGAVVSFNELTAQVRPVAIYRYHSADYRRNAAGEFRTIDSTEISRVLAYWRAGAYSLNPAGFDGYVTSTAEPTLATLSNLHSADYRTTDDNGNPIPGLGGDGMVDDVELGRAQAYWRYGGYSVRLTAPDGYTVGNTNAGPRKIVALSLEAEVEPLVTVSGPGTFNPGQTVTLLYGFNATDTLLSLGFRPRLPSGWSIVSVAGNGSPYLSKGAIVFNATTLPLSIEVSVTVQVPLNETRACLLGNTANYWQRNMDDMVALNAEPLVMAPEDANADGIADAWAAHYAALYGSTLEPDLDYDSDRHTVRQEYLTGTDPLDEQSVLQMFALNVRADGSTEISWSSVAGRVYTLQRADGTPAAANFQDIATGVAADPSGRNVMVDTADQSVPHFYRVILQ